MTVPVGGPYGSTITEHFRRPRNQGALPGADASAERVNPLCGDRVRIAIALDVPRCTIIEARFVANACAICVAAASLLTERVRGSDLSEAASLSVRDVLDALGGEIPVPRRRCATLPLEALQRAIASLTSRHDPAAERPSAPVVVRAVLLAAGAGRRFGPRHKLLELVPREGESVSVVRAAAETLLQASVSELIVVVGRDVEHVRTALDGLPARFVVNSDSEQGMSSSLRVGVRAAMHDDPTPDAVLIALGDQPTIDATVVSTVVATFGRLSNEDQPGAIVVPRYDGVAGHPVLFGRDVLTELLEVTGDRGGRAVIEREAERVRHVDFAMPLPLDVDTAADLERLRQSLRARERAP